MALRPVSHKVTQSFGVRNSAYRLGYHAGTDYGSPSGTAIKATTGGTARYLAGNNGGYGNVATLTLPNGDVVFHAHLSRAGKTGKVPKGATIGYTGSTGWSTGPHLHVEYRLKGNQNKPIDFEKWLKAHPESKPAPKPLYTTVKAGEGLSNIARRAGYKDWFAPTAWIRLSRLNGKGVNWLAYNRSLKPGQRIRYR